MFGITPIFRKKLEEEKFLKKVAKEHHNRMEELKNILENLLPTFLVKNGPIYQLHRLSFLLVYY
jgi:hypothetical protein